jgi:hypothetical protein
VSLDPRRAVRGGPPDARLRGGGAVHRRRTKSPLYAVRITYSVQDRSKRRTRSSSRAEEAPPRLPKRIGSSASRRWCTKGTLVFF